MAISKEHRDILEQQLKECFPNRSEADVLEALAYAQKSIAHKELMGRMTTNERNKLFKIRCNSKRGYKLTNDESDFCIAMLEKHEDEYKSMALEVNEQTKPFGA